MQVFHKDFLSPTGFVRNVATMLVGNVTAQAVTLLAALVVTRLYTPIGDNRDLFCFQLHAI
jgi:hypothetical protein